MWCGNEACVKAYDHSAAAVITFTLAQ
jgi:hypothetical protein